MPGKDDNAILCSGKLGDDIPRGQLAFGSIGGEGIIAEVGALKLRVDVVLKFLVIGAADRASTKRGHLFGVLKGAGRVDGGQRSGIPSRRDRPGGLRART